MTKIVAFAAMAALGSAQLTRENIRTLGEGLCPDHGFVLARLGPTVATATAVAPEINGIALEIPHGETVRIPFPYGEVLLAGGCDVTISEDFDGDNPEGTGGEAAQADPALVSVFADQIATLTADNARLTEQVAASVDIVADAADKLNAMTVERDAAVTSLASAQSELSAAVGSLETANNRIGVLEIQAGRANELEQSLAVALQERDDAIAALGSQPDAAAVANAADDAPAAAAG